MAIQQVAFKVKGINKDTAVSAFSSETAYDIRNMRITANDNNTQLSLENEKGNSLIKVYVESNTPSQELTIVGNTLGYSVIGKYLVLFTTDLEAVTNKDHIYRVHYEGDTVLGKEIFNGDLNFDIEHPIETLPLIESEDLFKVYWLDGINQPRVINILSETITSNNKQFDFLQVMSLTENVTVQRDSSRIGLFPAGTIQYCINYSNKNGQESSIAWTSPVLYITNDDRAIAADETSSSSYRVTVANIDTSFDYINLYSLIKTSEGANPVVKLVSKNQITNTTMTFYDTNTTGEYIDASTLLYKGGENIVANTFAAKDNTLFLGNITVKTLAINNTIRDVAKVVHEDEAGDSGSDEMYTLVTESTEQINNYIPNNNFYAYTQPSKLTNNIRYLRKGNVYRLGFQLQDNHGKWSDPVFVQDYTVDTNPSLNGRNLTIPRLKIKFSDDLLTAIRSSSTEDSNWVSARPLIVYPTDIQKSVIAEGIVCPTVSTPLERANNSPFARSSWFFRPYNIKYGYEDNSNVSVEARHLKFLGRTNKKSAEVQNIDYLSNYSNVGLYATSTDNDMSIADTNNVLSNYYFVDQSVVTFHSPDVDNILPYELNNCKLRIKGYFSIDAAKSAYTITASAGDNGRYGVIEGLNIDKEPSSLSNNILATNTLWKENNKYYATYPWHRTGALNNSDNENDTTDEDNEVNGVLKKKTLSNIRISNNITFLQRRIEAPSFFTPVINNGTNELSFLNKPNNSTFNNPGKFNNLKYIGGCNTTITPTRSYIIYGGDSSESFYDDLGKTTRPITIKYTSDKHVVIAFDYDRTTGNYKVLPIPAITSTNESDVESLYLGHAFWVNKATDDMPNQMLFPLSVKYLYYDSSEFDSLESSDSDLLHGDIIAIYSGTNSISLYKVNNPLNGSVTFSNNCTQYVVDRMVNDCVDILGVSSSVSSITRNTYQISGNTGNVVTLGSTSPDTATPLTGTTSIPGISEGSSEVMWVVELYRDLPEDNSEGTSTWSPIYGDPSNEYTSSGNKWSPAGDPVSIGASGDVTLTITAGDTIINRWDCLKTAPFSDEDTNSVVEIMSFMCESYKNTEGRYDKRRGLSDNTNTNFENFNLFNNIYNDKEGFFNYRTINLDSSISKSYPSQITYSLTKTLGEDVDTWTSLSLASILDLDGGKGSVTALRTINDRIIAFQPKGIAQILYNENVQIASSAGVPIEIGNSGKVQGKRYLSDSIGCYNKWSICKTPSNLYFVDDYNKDIFSLQEGIQNLSKTKGLHTWVIDKFKTPNVWNPSTFNGCVTHYNPIDNEVLFTTKDECLVYNENLQQFTGFYSYEDTPVITALNDNIIDIKNIQNGSRLWGHHKGDYNSFFGYIKPYSIDYIVNPNPTFDKIFNNVEFRSDSWYDDYLLSTTFDTLYSWNEYQKGHLTLFNEDHRSASLRKKFRIWRTLVPRDDANGRDRMRNPWIHLKLEKKFPKTERTVLHDTIVYYYI